MNDLPFDIKDPVLLDQIGKIIPFHGYLSTGAFIGLEMLNLAKKLLDIKEGERIYVTCESKNCIPDPFQIICGSTIGNNGLNILDHGKMAVTVNKAGNPGETVKGIRIVIDPEKTIKYPLFNTWFMNEAKISHEAAINELLKADGGVYSWYFIDLHVPLKSENKIVICSACGESFVQDENEIICKWCSDPEIL
ncbi:MAG: FmdE family protein [Methanobacterium sp.]|uniref:FmdE family protein n=1 Tax=Methanobacterium sp. TaxID=2164 RepID=UPI003C740178